VYTPGVVTKEGEDHGAALPFATVGCSRIMTCNLSDCSATPALPAKTIAAAFRGNVVQFMGDSITAELECDLRRALASIAVLVQPLPCDKRRTPVCPDKYANTFTDANGVNTTVLFTQVGCPWACVNNTNATDILELKRRVNGVNGGHNASVTVFNLGAHYTSRESRPSFQTTLDAFREVLADSSSRVIVIRSPNTVHFPTKSGDFDKEEYERTKLTKRCQAHLSILTKERQQDLVLRKMAADLQQDTRVQARGARVLYLDVGGLSDYSTMHPTTHGSKERSKYVLDCLHVCETCGVLRSWNSLLASLLIQNFP